MSSPRFTPSGSEGGSSPPRGKFDEEIHGDPRYYMGTGKIISSGSKVWPTLGIHAVIATIDAIAAQLVEELEHNGCFDTATDVATGSYWANQLAEIVRRRELGFRMLLDAMLFGNVTVRSDRNPATMEMIHRFLIPAKDVKESNPDRVIVELAMDTHGYIIRRKT